MDTAIRYSQRQLVVNSALMHASCIDRSIRLSDWLVQGSQKYFTVLNAIDDWIGSYRRTCIAASVSLPSDSIPDGYGEIHSTSTHRRLANTHSSHWRASRSTVRQIKIRAWDWSYCWRRRVVKFCDELTLPKARHVSARWWNIWRCLSTV